MSISRNSHGRPPDEHRIEARVRALSDPDDHGEHPETRAAIRVHAAFAGSAPDARRSAVLTDGDVEILALAVSVLARAAEEGRVADLDPEVDGYALVTLAGALGSDVAVAGAPFDRARAALDRQFRRLTGRGLDGP